MKTGLVASTVLHAVVLGFGLVTLSAPRAYEVAEEQAVMVDTIPVEEWTRLQTGDKDAPAADRPAPLPTQRPDVVENAEKVGENSVDTDAPPVPDAKPKPVETAALPEAQPEPVPAPDPTPDPAPTQPDEAAPAPVPATEIRPEPQPKQDVKPDPAPEAVAAESPEADAAELPDSAPAPQARPTPPEAQTAKAPERKDADKPKTDQARKPQSENTDNLLDDVAALLNKEKPSGGGAKRSNREASLGAETKRPAEKLSRSEMDALRQRLGGCWSLPAGIVDYELLKVSVRFRLDRAGNLDGPPELIKGGASSGPGRTAAESALRAVQKCAPFNLPGDKYETWSEVIVHFDPTDMF
ncbi:MAG: hypothetical protein ABJG86_14995 [Nitratireductor sp.]